MTIFPASLLQSSMLHDPSEIGLICWFGAQKIFIIISYNSCGWPWNTKPVISSTGSNSQQYIVWVKIIDFSFVKIQDI